MCFLIKSNTRYSERRYCLGDGKAVKGITTASSKKVKTKSTDVLTDKDLSHLLWWKEVTILFSILSRVSCYGFR